MALNRGSASSSGGNRGDGGSGGAFTGGGLQTPSTWQGTKAHFDSSGRLGGFSNGPVAKGFNGGIGQASSSFGAQGQGGSNTYNRNVGGMMGPRRQDAMPYPGGYAQPVISQPIPPPVQPVPVAAPPPPPPVAPPPAPVTPPVSFPPYPDPRMAAGWMVGPNFHNSWPNTNVPKNNLGNPGYTPQKDQSRAPQSNTNYASGGGHYNGPAGR